MLTVGANAVEVEGRLAGGELECPGCGGVLARWGWARTRVLRGGRGLVRLRPRRAGCGGCGGTHVLLPVFALLRRVDLAEVIGAALAAKAAGAGARSSRLRGAVESPHFSGQIPLCRIYIRNVSRSLKPHRTHFPQAALFPDAVVIPLDVVEYRGPCLFGIQP